MTPARVLRVRVRRIPLYGPCAYCGERHMPPLSYWYAVYASLARW